MLRTDAMDCQQVQDRLEGYVDEQLGDDERLAVEAHLKKCPECRRALAAIQSVDTVGKADFFPDPGPHYWKQLTRNIRDRVSEMEKQPVPSVRRLEKIKRVLWPESIGYRLAGLTAAAATVLVVIHLTLFQNGGFRFFSGTPKKSAVPAAEQGPETSAVGEMGRSVPEAPEEIVEHQDTQEASVMEEMKKGQPTTPIQQPEGAGAAADHRRERTVETGGLQKREVESLRDKEKSFDVQPAPQEMETGQEAKGIAPAKLDRAAEAETEETRPMPVLRTMKVADEEERAAGYARDFDTVYQNVQAASDLSQKIRLWEMYIQTEPDSQVSVKARVELARLYYQKAKEERIESEIERALRFHEDHIDLLESLEDASDVQARIDELKALLIKIREK
jgi:hypothetical protein